MGKAFVIGLAGMFVIGVLAVGSLVASLIALGGPVFGSENRSFSELSLLEQTITVGVIPAIVILAGVLPWWMGDFSFQHGLLLSVIVHVATIGIGMLIQQPAMFFVCLLIGWVVLPVVFSRE